MKRILALIIAVLSAIVFSSCTTVNNYYNNGSEASSETAVNSEPTVNSESATETQTIKEDTEMGLSELFEEEIKAITTKNKDKVYIFISRFTKEKNYLVVYKNDTKLGIYEVELTGQED